MSLIGKKLGQYEIVEEIGSGGMATVYKGYQASLGRHVAVKVLAGQLARDTTFRQRFGREARAVATMSHPHILPVYDFGEQEGVVYIVTEFVAGGTLKDYMGQPLEPGLAAGVASEIAQALDYAHRQGVIHRDVKPGNVLIAEDGRALLSDFGIARMVAGTQYTETGTSIGTPAYMSPEQGRGQEIDGRSDLYSLGIVLYEMVTGRPPFHADTPLAVLHQQVFAAPPPPRDLNPRIPRRLEKVILKALAKEPGDRFRTGREMGRALEKAVKLKPAEALLVVRPAEAPTVALTPPPSDTARRLARATGQGAAKVGRGTLRVLWGLTRLLLSVLVVLLIVALVIGAVVAVGGAYALSAFAERSIPTYSWGLDQFTAHGQTFSFSEAEINETVGPAIRPYALDVVQDITLDFVPPESVEVSAGLFDVRLRLQARLGLENGVPQVYLERLNDVPLYLVGGIISNGINRGLDETFGDAALRLERLEVQASKVVVQAGGGRKAVATPMPTSTLRPSPTAPPTEEPVGLLTVVNEIGEPVTLELAGQTWQLAAGESLELELAVDSYPYVFTVDAPGYEAERGTLRVVSGNTIFRISGGGKSEAIAQPTAAPQARPTRTPYCPHPGARITAPGVDVPLQGNVIVRGTANISGFDYYKLELGAGSEPEGWSLLGELHRTPVADGVLDVWDSRAYPGGVYVLRLVVVDETGNYQTCRVRVVVEE